MGRRSEPRTLIFYNRPEEFLPELSRRFPRVRFHVCRSYRQLSSALIEAKPEVILAYKFEPKPFPRRQILSWKGMRWLSVAFAGVDHIVPWDDGKLIVTNASGVAATEMAHYV